jgi:hypothetical protein
MNSRTEPPVRTEEDLRAALKSLESRAPSAAGVLRAVAERTPRHLPGTRWVPPGPGSSRGLRLRLGAGIAAAAAAVAGLILAVRPGPASAPHPQPGAGSSAAAPLGRAMLTAFSAATGDILYTTQTTTGRGVVMSSEQDWSWPLQPVPGQQQHSRSSLTQRTSPRQPLMLTEDDGFVFTAPRAGSQKADGELTVVCYAGTGQTGCGYDTTETPSGSWSVHHGQFLSPYAAPDILSPAAIGRGIINGQWRVTGHGQVAGQPAIELTENPVSSQHQGPTAEIYPLPTLLWVSTSTHLPLRMINGAGNPAQVQADWHYLPPTKANLALLQVPIPAGSQRAGS